MVDLSVCITTYNLESVIDQTLESVFNQQTGYIYEVLVGDDGSSDNTIKKVEEWKKKYPAILSVYVMPREHGKSYNHIFRAAANRINLLEHAKGRYIVFLDGDDFYIDVNKFQKQLDLLETHPGCSLCAHNMNFYYPHTGKTVPVIDTNRREGIIKAKTYWETGVYIHAEACIMRKDFMRGDRYDKYFDDNFIVFLALQNGDCYYIPDIMANYRQNENGYMTWEDSRCAIINLLDGDMEIQVNPGWRDAAISRHWGNIKYLFQHRKENLKAEFPELYQQAVEDQAVLVKAMLENKFPQIQYIWSIGLVIVRKIIRKIVRSFDRS